MCYDFSLVYLFKWYINLLGLFNTKFDLFRTVVVLFNPYMTGSGGSCLSQWYLPESEHNSAVGVRTHVLRFHSPAL